MKRLFLLVWIGCAVTVGAAEAVLDNSGNYIPLLDMPKEKLGAGLQKAVEKIKASKISTPEEATVAALRSTDDKLWYMRDARTILRVKSLLRIGRDVPELGENSDFVWFVHADMLGTDLEIFCVNASNGKVMRLFPEKTTPNKVSEPNEKVVMEMDSANPSNALITITFRNPVSTSEKGVVINYHSVFLQRDSAGTKTNTFLPISPGPTQGVSVCTFRIPENEVKTCTVHLAGVTSEPVGEGEVAREVKLGDPNQILRRAVDSLSKTNSISPGEKQSLGTRRCGKGFILTASKTDTDWLFVLKPNWNRGAWLDEITQGAGFAEAKLMLNTIAPGERIYWYPWQTNHPPNTLLVELREHCKKLGLQADGFPSEETGTDKKSVQATK